MSADLFAAFSDHPPSSSHGQRQSSTNAPSSRTAGPDPFAFLSPSSQNAQPPQKPIQQTSLWPAFQEQQRQQQQPQTIELQPSQWPSFQQPPVSQQNSNTDIWGDLSVFGGTQTGAIPFPKGDGDEDDGWGDFEVAAADNPASLSAPVPAPVLSISPAAANMPLVPVTKPEPSPRTRIMRASTLDLITNHLVDTRSTPKTLETWQERTSWEQPENPIISPARAPNPDPNVLFDADDFDGAVPPDEEDGDDFGEFETVAAPPPTSTPKPAPTKSALDMISDLDFGPAPAKTRKEPPSQLLSTLSVEDSRYPQAPKSPSFQERNPFPGLGLTTPKASVFPKEVKPKSPSPVTAWPNYDDQHKERNSFDESWGEFEDLPVSSWPKPDPRPKAQTSTAIKKAGKAAPTAPSDWDWDAWEGVDSPEAVPSTAAATTLPDREVSGPPPTNVPPPSILLSIFPELLSLANSSLFKPLTSQPASVKDRVMANPTTANFLRGYLALATVAARIIAGRKLRWHRDKFLSQSMTITAAGGKGGMKLSGIDKTQARSEDREAADVVAVWKEYVGRLRSAIVAANSNATTAGETQLKVPELAETTVVQTAKGVATAPKPCIVCGLKREERVPRVDFDVEDSFGEWWVEHWGHRTCRNFWLEHEVRLRQR